MKECSDDDGEELAVKMREMRKKISDDEGKGKTRKMR